MILQWFCWLTLICFGCLRSFRNNWIRCVLPGKTRGSQQPLLKARGQLIIKQPEARARFRRSASQTEWDKKRDIKKEILFRPKVGLHPTWRVRVTSKLLFMLPCKNISLVFWVRSVFLSSVIGIGLKVESVQYLGVLGHHCKKTYKSENRNTNFL